MDKNVHNNYENISSALSNTRHNLKTKMFQAGSGNHQTTMISCYEKLQVIMPATEKAGQPCVHL